MKKKTIVKVLVIMALVLGVTGCNTGNSPAGTTPDPQENKTIVCFGDSLTEGYGASKPGSVDKSKSYPAYLQKKVSRTVVNSGITGDTAAGGLARVEEDVLSYDPGLVVVLLGANDFFHLRPANETKSDLQAILNKLKDGERKVYLASFIGDASWEEAAFGMIPGMTSGLSSTIVSLLLSDYKRIFAELVAENRDIGYIPNIWTDVWGIHMSDPIHPNAAGYEIIADIIYNAISP